MGPCNKSADHEPNSTLGLSPVTVGKRTFQPAKSTRQYGIPKPKVCTCLSVYACVCVCVCVCVHAVFYFLKHFMLFDRCNSILTQALIPWKGWI